MKKIFLLLAAGFIPPIILFLFMKLVSLNLSYSLIVGVVSLLIVSIWQLKNPASLFLKILIITIPISSVYYLLIVREIQGLWIVLPIFVLTVVIGLKSKKEILILFTLLGLLVSVSLVSFLYIPEVISKSLSEIIDETTPSYEIENLLEGNKFSQSTTSGKVIVLDFFGTWCAPCIAEMQELQNVREKLINQKDDLLFIIACTDTGGDTPDKAIKFHSKKNLPFQLGYDYKSTAHKKFDFTGVPALVVIDKKGKMRFKHEGYNQAENLEYTLISVLENLLKE